MNCGGVRCMSRVFDINKKADGASYVKYCAIAQQRLKPRPTIAQKYSVTVPFLASALS